ncbi:MAG: hypothetical protein PHT41_05175 [Candidatus Omnitrophica bacterium]|nr:hypothetical protein [Candidatus Omnitrophota bacterium]MDD5238178.1 hypothetical protein [Candidatus Omnitrophota bacterium]
MRKITGIIFLFCFSFSLFGCSVKEKPAIAIGKIKISVAEFNRDFEKSLYANSPKEEAHKRFAEYLIDRKLILKEAEREGLDKGPEFLNSVQAFWEQALLKLALDKKIKELSSQIGVSDQEVRVYYEVHKETFSRKEVTEVYDQIKLQLFKAKQKEALDKWISALRAKTKISIDNKLLGLE